MYRATLTKDTTPQQVYDHLKAACEAGSFPSVGLCQYSGMYNCKYRVPENPNLACAIGIFIPDNKYNEALEHNNALRAMELCDMEIPKWMLQQPTNYPTLDSLAKLLQRCHDATAYDKWDDDVFLSLVKKELAYNGIEVV